MTPTAPYKNVADFLLFGGEWNCIVYGAAQAAGSPPIGPKRSILHVPAAIDSSTLVPFIVGLTASGLLGSETGERTQQDGLWLQAVVRSGVWSIEDHEHYEIAKNPQDIAAALYLGNIAGQTAWDGFLRVEIDRQHLSDDPGKVGRNAPQGLGEQDAAGHDAAWEAVNHLVDLLRAALRSLEHYPVELQNGVLVPITEAPEWAKIAPLFSTTGLDSGPEK